MQASATKTEAQASLKQPSTTETTQPTMIQTSSCHRMTETNSTTQTDSVLVAGGWGLHLNPWRWCWIEKEDRVVEKGQKSRTIHE